MVSRMHHYFTVVKAAFSQIKLARVLMTCQPLITSMLDYHMSYTLQHLKSSFLVVFWRGMCNYYSS